MLTLLRYFIILLCRLSDMDSDFVKYVEEFIYENISCYLASGQFAPVPSSLDEENCHVVSVIYFNYES